MNEFDKIKLSSGQILLNLLGDSLEVLMASYKLYPSITKNINSLQKDLEVEKRFLSKKIYELEKNGIVKKYTENKKNIIRITPLGYRKAIKYALNNYRIKKPRKWDKKWRVIIFDIPEDKKNIRNVIRLKLKNCGFYQLQKSVWIHPFECKELIWSLKYTYSASAYIQYLIVETLETEINLVKHFYDQKILTKRNL